MEVPRWDNENLFWVQPDPQKIQCSKCILRAKDRLDGKINGATLGICDAYNFKPPQILMDGEDCPYFIDENEDDGEEDGEPRKE